MKYSIESISKGKTIKSVDIINHSKDGEKTNSEKTTVRVIVVNYLDGTQDIVKFDSEVLKNIEQVMVGQAKRYANDKNAKKVKYSIAQYACFVASLVGLVSAFLASGLLPLIISIAAIVASGAIAVDIQVRKNDLDKYELFVKEGLSKVEDYKKIISEESKLVNSKANQNPKFEGVISLDDLSKGDLREVIEKVERRDTYTGKQKVKSLENSGNN